MIGFIKLYKYFISSVLENKIKYAQLGMITQIIPFIINDKNKLFTCTTLQATVVIYPIIIVTNAYKEYFL